jgi:hypothetical protein
MTRKGREEEIPVVRRKHRPDSMPCSQMQGDGKQKTETIHSLRQRDTEKWYESGGEVCCREWPSKPSASPVAAHRQ